ncbi:uncharacterized protein [Apostichopus japonicus]|uniref:uncharacterized protein isoform X2 n=1 Tax=Stichopus japonicus TaxID=307972 RepID=UPI003AB41451
MGMDALRGSIYSCLSPLQKRRQWPKKATTFRKRCQSTPNFHGSRSCPSTSYSYMITDMSHLSLETNNHAAANNGASNSSAALLYGAASSSLADIEVTAVSPPFTTSRSIRRKRNSIVSLAVSGSRLLSHRRGSAMPVLQHGEFDVSTKSQQVLGLRNDEWNRVQTKVMTIFEGGKLGPNELFELNEMVRVAIKSEIGSFISEYYKKSLLKRGMEALYNAIEDDGDKQLLESLSKVWDRFYSETLPTLRAIFYPIQTKGLTMSQITLLGFRDHVLLRTKLKESLELNAQADIPQNISQMLLVLQNIREHPHPSEDFLQLESLVAMVVSPYLGTRGLYMGGDSPVIKAKPAPVEENATRHAPIKSSASLSLASRSATTPNQHRQLSRHLSIRWQTQTARMPRNSQRNINTLPSETSKDRVKRYSLQTLTSSQSAHDLCTSRDPQPLTPTADTPPAQPPLPTTTSHSNTRRPRTPIRKPMNITSLETLNEVDRPLPELTTRRRTQSNVDFETGDSDGHEEDYSVC